MSEPIPAKPKYGDVRIGTHPLWGVRIQAFRYLPGTAGLLFSKPCWTEFSLNTPEFQTIEEAEAWLDKVQQDPIIHHYYRRVPK